ncbi:MAG: hypothetical protein HZC55_17005 [Verrucomicrobia bacterium]|nr:hypothetical protein [Verrucomicrobiota bacterium]
MSLRLGSMLLTAGLVAATAAEPPERSHLDFRADARAAAARKDFAAARAATRAALERRPDSPLYRYNLAAFSALLGERDAALAALDRLADLGVYLPAERDPDFASLQGTPPFRRVLERLASHRAPRGQVELVGKIDGRAGIIEGIAYREATGDLFLSDVHLRGIWRRDRGGQVTRFSVEDEGLLGLFGLALDEARGALWAAMAGVPEVSGYTSEWRGAAGLAEFDLRSGEVRRIIPVPDDGRDHALGDLLVAPDGTVYATDFKAPVIWKFAPGAEEMEKVVDSPRFASLQGIALRGRTLLVADYSHGLFALDLASRALHQFTPPPNATLLGIDGLILAADGLVATQNGVEPQRVVKFALNAELNALTGCTVLAAGLPDLQDLSLVTLMNGRPVVVAGAGWEGFDPAKSPAPAPHVVRLFQVELP